MIISLIAAIAENYVIGKNNRLIWRMPADMKYFKDKTTGHCVVTGRKNYESIPEKFRPLPDRKNMVVTRQKNYSAPGATVVASIDEAVDMAAQLGEQELFIIGGGEIYTQTILIAHKLYVTHIHQSFDGDAFFPEIDKNTWNLHQQVNCGADEKNPHSYSFCEYVRK
jgi:dihydrofolate reductase